MADRNVWPTITKTQDSGEGSVSMSDAFKNIGKVQYEGPRTKNAFAFKHYNPDEVIEGKTMKEHLRFSVVYWHTMCGAGADMFGWGTAKRPWDEGCSGIEQARRRVPVF